MWGSPSKMQTLGSLNDAGGLMKRFLLMTSCMALLAGCDLIPRGAGLQAEVLAATREDDGTTTMDFAVEVVTRENLATFVRWPAADDTHYHWIRRVDQPNTRTIANGDTLRITIWSTEDNGLLTAPGQRFVTLPDMRVSANGTVFLPYVDTVRVRGMSPERARAMIEDRYMSVTPSAQVQIELIEGRARTVSLCGWRRDFGEPEQSAGTPATQWPHLRYFSGSSAGPARK